MTTADDEPADHARAIVRLTAQYFLRTLDVAKAVHDGDPIKAIIFTAIWSANSSHLRPDLGFYASDDPPPDDMRRPITISAIAESLGMPNETVRRYVKKLIADGLCQTHGHKGVIIPRSVFIREDMINGVRQQHRYTLQYHRAISRLLPE